MASDRPEFTKEQLGKEIEEFRKMKKKSLVRGSSSNDRNVKDIENSFISLSLITERLESSLEAPNLGPKKIKEAVSIMKTMMGSLHFMITIDSTKLSDPLAFWNSKKAFQNNNEKIQGFLIDEYQFMKDQLQKMSKDLGNLKMKNAQFLNPEEFENIKKMETNFATILANAEAFKVHGNVSPNSEEAIELREEFLSCQTNLQTLTTYFDLKRRKYEDDLKEKERQLEQLKIKSDKVSEQERSGIKELMVGMETNLSNMKAALNKLDKKSFRKAKENFEDIQADISVLMPTTRERRRESASYTPHFSTTNQESKVKELNIKDLKVVESAEHLPTPSPTSGNSGKLTQ